MGIIAVVSTYLLNVCREWFLAEHMQILPDGRESLGSMDIGARRYPYGLEVWVIDHRLVVIVDHNF